MRRDKGINNLKSLVKVDFVEKVHFFLILLLTKKIQPTTTLEHISTQKFALYQKTLKDQAISQNKNTKSNKITREATTYITKHLYLHRT